MKTGIFYGISVGTGDPELITVKGLRLLQHCPVVAFPAGIKGQGIAEAIVAPWLKPNQQTLALKFPYVREKELLEAAWEIAAKEVWQHLNEGVDVAFACEGDISFYSTFSHLARTLKRLYPEVKILNIPGICSPVAAAADLGIPLTVNQEKLTILPALYAIDNLETALDNAEVLVLLKVSSVYPQVWDILDKWGLLQQSYVVVKAGSSDRVIYADLTNHRELKLPYFSLLIVSCLA